MKEMIELSISVKANVGEVWHALTDRDELENWWSEDVVIEPKVGGKFIEKWQDDEGTRQLASGRVLISKPKKQIAFTWREKDWPQSSVTECSFTIEPQGPTKSLLKLTHSGWETLPPERRTVLLKEFKVGWTYHLKELKSYLDE